MTEVVKPPPAGTKETPDYVPSVKLSSVKSMFENSSSPTSAAPLSPRRRQPSRDSCTSSEIRQGKLSFFFFFEGFYLIKQLF